MRRLGFLMSLASELMLVSGVLLVAEALLNVRYLSCPSSAPIIIQCPTSYFTAPYRLALASGIILVLLSIACLGAALALIWRETTPRPPSDEPGA